MCFLGRADGAQLNGDARGKCYIISSAPHGKRAQRPVASLFQIAAYQAATTNPTQLPFAYERHDGLDMR